MARRTRSRALATAAAYLLVALTVALGWLWHSLPEQIWVEPGQTPALARFAWVQPQHSLGAQNAASTRAVGSYQTTFALGGWLPVKTIRTTVLERPVVTVCGTPFGVKMFSEGALVVGFSDLNTAEGTVNPAKQAGLRMGDRVIRMDGAQTKSNDAVADVLAAAEGRAVEVVYVRGGEQRSTFLTAVWDASAQKWRAGMWVRDSSAGVGTLTFVWEEKGVFAGLGHPISDSDTGESVALRSGEIVACEIVGCTRGTAGSPGELKGHFVSGEPLGTIRSNRENGVYGTTSAAFAGQKLPAAFAQEIRTGKAEILTTVSGQTPQTYTVEIEKINDASTTRNMILRVTDKRLLAETGGIVQGMSGSPILQDGKIVGAVTHVLVNDPTRGYGIFIENMLEAEK